MLFENLAYAQAAAPASSPMGGTLGGLMPIILIFVVMYFLIIRPQQKRQKEHQAMLNAVKAGDKIITNGGLYGTVVAVQEDGILKVEIANGVKVDVAKGGIAAKVNTEAQNTSNVVSK